MNKQPKNNFEDDHHIVHTGLEWEQRPEAKRIRLTPSLIIHILRTDHDWIHANSPAVPVLPVNMLQQTNSYFRPTGDTLTDISRLQSSIERASKHPRAHRIESAIGMLAVESLDIQRLLVKQILQPRGRRHL